jgi:hypothetical protein
MATVVLQTVGAAIGGALGGPFGAILGRAAGAAAGYAIDQTYLAKDQVIQGPRLENSRILSSSEGAPIPRVYGRNRISGQIVWATRFEEVASTEKRGGKGTGNSTSTTTFAYFANFAVGICEGPVSGIRRVWADGKELDLTSVEFRFYNGNESQEADPLIEAKQGIGRAPAYRGTAYIVFEGMPLEDYGNRIPQLSFEVIRSIGNLEKQIKSITVIPGSTEFGYDTELVASGGGEMVYDAKNRHSSIATTDWQAAIDELQMVCPNLESVSLVVSWFGTDLRANECQVLPGVTTKAGSGWQVAGYKRHEAHVVSSVNDRPAFGGTPDDASVIRAIQDLKSRGLKAVLYPFIMMDIPDDNNLPGSSGENKQPVYPWRGMISCFPQPGHAGTSDKTNEARNQLNVFSQAYNEMILHYADLCKQAGGVDGFLVGSELRGLTRVRDESGAFPFVENLIQLANQCSSILGSETFITYGADWSEYFGYQPQDETGDVLFNLDELWAAPSIDFIGIDNYMPLSDWRDEGDTENPYANSIYSLDYLKSNITAQEGHEWYYASAADRVNRIRTLITDGQGEPWIYRYKDLQSWWSNPHYNRINGIRQTTATAWQPKSKPFMFTELGCPAVDKGTNQPNVFFDPKSDQSNLPYFSSGGRDDLVQRRYLEAHYAFWARPENNPLSDLYQGRMVHLESFTPWAWDARPFPWFPLQLDTWSDGENWHLGHWLTGRLGGCSLDDLIRQILQDFGHDTAKINVDGVVDGYLIPGQTSARAALEPLLALHNIQVFEENGDIIMQDHAYADQISIDQANLVQEEGEAELVFKRGNELELPGEAVINHGSVFGDYEETATKSRRLEGMSDRQISLQSPVIMPDTTALKLADMQLREGWVGREEATLSIPIGNIALTNGDIIQIGENSSRKWLVNQVERHFAQTVSLSSIVNLPNLAAVNVTENRASILPRLFGKPDIILLDLPLLRAGNENKSILHVAINAEPWAGVYNLYSSAEQEAFTRRSTITNRATLGRLGSGLAGRFEGRWDYQNHLTVELGNGAFESATRTSVLNGANALAIQSLNGSYEIVQFSHAQLQADGKWKLSQLLRGQMGTNLEAIAGAQKGARVIVLNEALNELELSDSEVGLELNWRAGPSRDNPAEDSHQHLQFEYSARSKKMLSPAHLKATQMNGRDYKISWVRRGRINSDTWAGADIPLDAASELYEVQVWDEDNNLQRRIQTPYSRLEYTMAMQQEDGIAIGESFRVLVSQLNDTGEPGLPAQLTIHHT